MYVGNFITFIGFQAIIIPPVKQSWGFDISRYLNNPALSDIIFNVEGTQFYAHRIILCSQSPSFRSLLEGEWKENQQKELELKDIKITDKFHEEKSKPFRFKFSS